MTDLQNLLIKTTKADTKRDDRSRKMRGVSALSKNYPRMGKHAFKSKKSYVDFPRDRSELTSLIHFHGQSLEQCKLLNEFVTKYAAASTFKEQRQERTSEKQVQENQEVNAIVLNLVDYIVLQEDKHKNSSGKREPQEYENTNS